MFPVPSPGSLSCGWALLTFAEGTKMDENSVAQLPVLRDTGLIRVREAEGRQVFTYADIAEGLQVGPSVVRNLFNRHQDAWEPVETGVSRIETPSGIQDVRWFTARGAMRFCRRAKSPRADALFNHLLDLRDAECVKSAAACDPLVEVNRLAGLVNQILPALAGSVREVTARQDEHGDRLAVVEAAQADLDPAAIALQAADIETGRRRVLGELRGSLRNLVDAIVAQTKVLPAGDTEGVSWRSYPRVWRAIHRHVGVSRLDDYVEVDQFTRGIAFAQSLLRALGVDPLAQVSAPG